MSKHEKGAPGAERAPIPKRSSKALKRTNSSVFSEVRKPLSQNSRTAFSGPSVRAQLKHYLDLGLEPIPLKGKRPLVKWTAFHPRNIADLNNWIRPGINWGVKCGPNLTVIDFDTVEAYTEFMTANLENIPDDAPIVQTGRGYHLYLKSTRPVNNQALGKIDIKAEGGYVVCPPSIHDNGKEYHFVRPLLDHIPEVDFDIFTFPSPVKREYTPRDAGTKKDRLPTDDDRRKVNFEAVGMGAYEGTRHNVLVHYLGVLINAEIPRHRVRKMIRAWNEMNVPPLSDEELVNTLEYVWGRYQTRDVQTSTLNKLASVNVWTDAYTAEYAELDWLSAPKDVRAYDWATETNDKDPREFCGKSFQLLRRKQWAISIIHYCGRWDCDRCGKVFHDKWVTHLAHVTESKAAYTIECKIWEWVAVHKRIKRAGGQYAKITTDETTYTIVTDAHIDGSSPIDMDMHQFLEEVIPMKSQSKGSKPVTTSRAWQRHSEKSDSEWKEVTKTWLPLYVQDKAAKDAGFTVEKPGHWHIPDGVDVDLAWDELTKRIRWWETHIHSLIEGDGEQVNPGTVEEKVKELMIAGARNDI